ncbi:MAG TPA: hypothetical protein VF789_04165 [Thermoanaerobaculia bacterium]
MDWMLSGVGMLGGEPVVSVDPVRIRRGAPQPAEEPLILRWNGKTWNTLISEPLPKGTSDPWAVAVREERSVLLLGDSKRNLWVANANRYRIRQYSSAGRLRLTLQVGEGTVRRREDAARVQQAFEKKAKASGTVAQAASALPVIEGLAEGRDGRMYFLVRHSGEGSDFVLDRYDPVTGQLERAELRLKDPGVITMASGKNGLYFAAFSPQKGRWRLEWQDIDAASWKPVDQARVEELTEPES